MGNAQILSPRLSKTKPGTRNTLNQTNKNNFQYLCYRFVIGFLFVVSFAYCQFSMVVPGMFRGVPGVFRGKGSGVLLGEQGVILCSYVPRILAHAELDSTTHSS